MDDAGLDVAIGSEHGGFDVGSLKNFVDIASDDGFTSGAGNTDEFEVLGRVAVISRKNLGTSTGGTGAKLTVIHIYIISHMI